MHPATVCKSGTYSCCCFEDLHHAKVCREVAATHLVVEHDAVGARQVKQMTHGCQALVLGQPCGLQRCLLADAEGLKQTAGQGRQAFQPHPLAEASAAAIPAPTDSLLSLLVLQLPLPAGAW